MVSAVTSTTLQAGFSPSAGAPASTTGAAVQTAAASPAAAQAASALSQAGQSANDAKMAFVLQQLKLLEAQLENVKMSAADPRERAAEAAQIMHQLAGLAQDFTAAEKAEYSSAMQTAQQTVDSASDSSAAAPAAAATASQAATPAVTDPAAQQAQAQAQAQAQLQNQIQLDAAFAKVAGFAGLNVKSFLDQVRGMIKEAKKIILPAVAAVRSPSDKKAAHGWISDLHEAEDAADSLQSLEQSDAMTAAGYSGSGAALTGGPSAAPMVAVLA